MKKAIVGIIMGSDSDLVVMSEAAKVLEEFDVPYELTVVSAHRTPERMYEYAKKAKKNGLKVIIAGAGGSAHLPGVTASLTPLPVIGVPVKSSTAAGIDSLFSIVQMPPGIPVATVAINGAKNAGLLALKILSLSDAKLSVKIVKYQNDLNRMVKEKAAKLEKHGFRKYLSSMK